MAATDSEVKKTLGADGLLGIALSSLEAKAALQKRHDIFATNKEAITGIKKAPNVTTRIDRLKITNFIGGTEQDKQPLVHGESFEIDLGRINFGLETAQETVQKICRDNDISFDKSSYSAQFTPVIVALPGSHAGDDHHFTGVTNAEFTPVFKSDDQDRRVFAACAPLNSGTGKRLDHLKVFRRTEMPCINRHGHRQSLNSAIQAIEIPNSTVAEMSGEQPERFKLLQEQAALVIYIEYDLIPPQPSRSSGGVPSSARDGGFQSARHEIVEQSVGGAEQVSPYSVIEQGGRVENRSISVSEPGTRRLSSIKVYLVGAMVVNTNGQRFTQEQCNHVALLMQKRAQELNQLYLPYKTYTFENLIAAVNNHIRHHSIDTYSTDIFEHAMLKSGAVDENPSTCSYKKSSSNSKYFDMELGISFEAAATLVRNLKQRFGSDICEHLSERYPYSTPRVIQFSLAAISKIFPTIQQSLDEILSVPRNLLAYRNFSHKKSPIFEEVMAHFNNLMKTAGISIQRTDATEIVLLRMLGCKEELHHARFQAGSTFSGRMLDVNFFLDISETAARQIIDVINLRFQSGTTPARFLSANSKLSDQPQINFCEIAIDGKLLCSNEFLLAYKDTLTKLIEDEPLLIESLRIASMTQRYSSSTYADRLKQVAQTYEKNTQPASSDSHSNLANSRLADTLRTFSDVITNKQYKQSDRRVASDGLRRAICFFESTQSSSENAAFKKGDKCSIKEAQRALVMK